jgi:ribonuclease HII
MQPPPPQGYKHVAGIDEAGRGPLAGPVVAAACIIPEGVQLEGVNDSKAMSEKARERLYAQIVGDPRIVWAVWVTGPPPPLRRAATAARRQGARIAARPSGARPAPRPLYIPGPPPSGSALGVAAERS